jgi:hypothetical protein
MKSLVYPFPEYLLQSLDHIRRLHDGFLGHRFEFLTAGEFNIPVAFLRVGEEFRIVDHLLVGLAQDL